MPRGKNAGFTLVEVLLVIVVFMLSIALVSPFVARGLNGSKPKVTAKNIAATFKYARVLALRERQNYFVQIHDGKVLLTSSDGGNIKKEIIIPEEVKIDPPRGASLAFYPGGGSSGGVFEVKDTQNRTGYVVRVEASNGSVMVKGL